MPYQCPQSPNTPREQISTFSGLLVRLFWMIGGNSVLFFLIIAILTEGTGDFTRLDLAYWLVVAAQIAIRYYDIRFLGGATADNASATMQDWVRYSVILFIGALIVWGTVHIIPQA